jgi:hypothetical protein
MIDNFSVWVALASGAAAVTLWSVVFGRTLLDVRHRSERRASWVLMAATALLASLGTFASAIGYAIQTGVLGLDWSQPALSMVASIGRGALLMAAALVLTHARPPKESR